jgi:TRAP-type C4-dicarboxylate transport system permease small subunit
MKTQFHEQGDSMADTAERKRDPFRVGRKISLVLLIEIPAIAVMFIMMLHISANAVLRTFARAPVAHTLEVTEYWYMPIIVFVGFIAAQMRKEHVKADFIYNFLPHSTRPYVLGVGYIFVTLVTAGFAWFGLSEALMAFDVRRVAGASGLPAWPTYFLAPLSFGVLTVQFAVFSVQSFRGKTVDERDRDELDELEEATTHDK